MNSVKNVLMLIPNLDYGGAQQAFAWLSNELAKKYHVINVVFNTHNMGPYEFNEKLISLDVSSADNRLLKILNFLRRIKKVRKIKQQYNVDLSISFLEGADYVNVLSRVNESIIISVRGSKYYDQNISGITGYLRHRLLLPWVFNQADAITVVSNGIKSELITRYRLKRPSFTVYNAILTKNIQQAKSEKLPGKWHEFFALNRENIIMSHGRLAAEKGYRELITVLGQLLHEGISFRYFILGDGPDRMDLIRHAEKLSIPVWHEALHEQPADNMRIFFLGYQPNPFCYLARASVYALPSMHEGMSNALLEALACGLPVVASDCPYAPREVLSQGGVLTDELVNWTDYGVLVRPWQNPYAHHAWKKALIRLLAEKDLREYYSMRAIERCKDFAPEKVADCWITVIEKCCVRNI
jgi:glycosyltransferase involved in cell wall biosynthesis